MTEIRVVTEGDNYRITAKGHSGYAPEGQDIVCAAISATMLLTATIAICHGGELIGMEKGYTEILMPKNKETQLIIDGLEIAMETMTIKHGKNISFFSEGV